ncbi:MAG: LytTR family transcriptional regulator [Chryseobacterium sp.]|nr:MAG: LytTR family transcriptional regulator [Chryseobacterium sp.]
MENKHKPVIHYKDFLFRGVACLLAAHYIVMMGRPDLSTFQALMISSYYPTLLINYGIALMVGMGVKQVTMMLDRFHDWYTDIWRRAMLQFLFGVIGVSLLSFFLVWLYFFAFGQDILDSGYLDYELPFSIALITILNFYYVASYFYMNPRSGQGMTPLVKEQTELDRVPYDYPEESPIVDRISVEPSESSSFNALESSLGFDESPVLSNNNMDAEQRKEPKKILIVDTALRSIPIKLKDVVMFFIYNRTLFIGMKGIKNLGDCYQYSGTLSELMEDLDERDFFRINRQCIVNFEMIDAYENSGDKGLRLLLNPEYVKLDDINAEPFIKTCLVSGDKVPAFKDWMNR